MFYYGKYGALDLCMSSVFYTRLSFINHPGCLSIFHTDLKHYGQFLLVNMLSSTNYTSLCRGSSISLNNIHNSVNNDADVILQISCVFSGELL